MNAQRRRRYRCHKCGFVWMTYYAKRPQRCGNPKKRCRRWWRRSGQRGARSGEPEG